MSELRLIGIALAIATLIGGFWAYTAHQRSIGAANAVAAQAQEDARESGRRATAVSEVAHDAQLQVDAARASVVRADAARASMRVQLDAYVSKHKSADPIAAAASDPDPIGLLAEVLGRFDDAAGRYAAEADYNRIGWDACVESYRALTP